MFIDFRSQLVLPGTRRCVTRPQDYDPIVPRTSTSSRTLADENLNKPGHIRADQRATTRVWESELAAGDGLRNCHHALRSFSGELPPLAHLFDEAERIVHSVVIEDEDRLIFRRAFIHAHALLNGHGLPVQPLHGDAGLGNVLTGGVWHDWEDSSIGPIIWDLAALVSTARITGTRAQRAEATLVAYGDDPGLDYLDAFVALRGLQVLAWSLLVSTTERKMRSSTETRLRWFREYPWDD
ncbi:MAG: phosphotransferase [Solirubrobacteraceae bacterium]